MKLLITWCLSIVLTGIAQLAPNPVVPTSAPEPPETTIVAKTTIDPPEPPKQQETKPEQPVDIVKQNPQGCDTTTQWIWADGSCHDKQVKKQVAKPTGVPSADCYYSLLSQYEWDVATMQRIMRAESGCNPTNHNWADNHRSCKGSYGLMQIGCVHGYSVEYLSDPANNIAVAYKVWKSQGYRAWTTY